MINGTKNGQVKVYHPEVFKGIFKGSKRVFQRGRGECVPQEVVSRPDVISEEHIKRVYERES